MWKFQLNKLIPTNQHFGKHNFLANNQISELIVKLKISKINAGKLLYDKKIKLGEQA